MQQLSLRTALLHVWKDLPNARHRKYVLDTLKEHPSCWKTASTLMSNSSGNGFVTQIVDSLVDTKVDRKVKLYPQQILTLNNIHLKDVEWAIATGVLTALAHYNDCDKYIDMGYSKLLVYAKLTENPQACLLVPYLYVRLLIEDSQNNN